MYQIMIVDDEPMMRMAIRNLVDWQSINCQVVAESSNGKEALEYMKHTMPDVILTDIVMPVMNGIELIQSLNEKDIRCVVIVLSGHDDFAYVRDALILGAADYLLKSEIDADTIIGTVQRTLKLIPEKKHQASRDDGSNRQEVFSMLLNRKQITNRQWAELGVSSERQQLQIACIVIPKSEKMRLFDADWDQNAAFNTISQILYEVLPEICVCQDTAGRMFVIRTCNTNLEEDFFAEMQRFARLTKRYANILVEVGISARLNRDAVNLILEQCVNATEANFYETVPDEVNQYQDAMFNQDVRGIDRIHALLLKRLRSVMTRNDYEEIIATIEREYTEICAQKYKPADLKRMTENILVFIANFLLEGEHVNYEPMRIREEVFGCETFLELKELVQESIHRWTLAACERHLERSNPTLYAALTFIRSHYQDPDLSLQKVAEYVNVNSSYLSRLFNTELSVNYTDFLLNLRIDRSKELLIETCDSIERICEQIGYAEPKYFSKVFKRTVGVTPSAFRKEHMQKVKNRH